MHFDVSKSAGNIFSTTSGALSRLRSGGSGGSEAGMRSLSHKDSNAFKDTIKDEVEYEFTDMMNDQQKEWEDDEIDRSFGIFQD